MPACGPVKDCVHLLGAIASLLLHCAVPQDYFMDPTINREYQFRTDAMRVFPCNERDQGRWNSDPFQLDGGSGMSETDGGVWLLPYWLARANGLVTAPTA